MISWPQHSWTLWADFATIKNAAGLQFRGAFYRIRFGFANANADSLPKDVLQQLMAHRDRKTTQRYVNVAKRLKRQGTADRLHVPARLAN